MAFCNNIKNSGISANSEFVFYYGHLRIYLQPAYIEVWRRMKIVDKPVIEFQKGSPSFSELCIISVLL